MLPSFWLLSNNHCTAANPITGRNLTQTQFLKNAYKWTESPSHSGSPAGQEWGQKGHRTRPSVLPYPGRMWQGPGMHLFQQRPRMAPLKKQTKPKTNSLLDSQFLCGFFIRKKMASLPITKDSPPFAVSNSIWKPEVMLILSSFCGGSRRTRCHRTFTNQYAIHYHPFPVTLK